MTGRFLDLRDKTAVQISYIMGWPAPVNPKDRFHLKSPGPGEDRDAKPQLSCHKKAGTVISGGLSCLFEHNFQALLIYARAQAPHQIAKVLRYEPIP
jgi:hypothetical protein